MTKDETSESSKRVKVYSRKTTGNSIKIYTRNKFDKETVKSNANGNGLLPSASIVGKSDMRMTNSASIEKLKQGIVLKHNARGYLTKSGSPIRYETKKSQQRATSSMLDDNLEIRTLLHEKKNIGATLVMASRRKSLGQNSFGMNKLQTLRAPDIVQKGIIKLTKILNSYLKDEFPILEYINIYTIVYKMCTQSPHCYTQQLYDKYKD